MNKYDPKKIEKKWQNFWKSKKVFEAKENSKENKGKKKYVLIEFPYPSGAGLHMGHLRPYLAGDAMSKYYKLKELNTVYPIGWDAFGLPAENYAIKNKVHPEVSTKKNIANAKKQLMSWGTGFDWSREINTSDPKYYKWTQKIFLELLSKGLAYEATGLINWCPKDKTGLANEEVIDGKCERCGTPVEKKELRQWYLKITDYAEKLLEGLKHLPEWPEAVKIQQENWIGKSEGAEIDFYLDFKKNPDDNKRRGPNGEKAHLKIFTTRPDTIFGATYLVLAPEHLWVTLATDNEHNVLENKEEVKKYIRQVKNKSEIERTSEGKEKTGVELKGVKAINPASQKEIPIFVADYVLGGYGTGAIMAVPAHDTRDFEFAKKFNLPIRQVVAEHFIDEKNPPRKDKQNAPRIVVQGIVRNLKNNAVLQIVWKKFPWKTFVIGGAENNENLEDAVKREVYEETGYKNFSSIRRIGHEMRSEWYAEHKDENRYAHMHVFELVLADDLHDEINDEEKSKHSISWVPYESIPKSFNPVGEISAIWRALNSKEDHIFTGKGKVINSGNFSELSSGEAIKRIIEFVGGKIVTKYKLRDWVFSRQRYWGEPIPVIHCDKHGAVPVPDKDLPVILPKVKNYEPTGTGESPLAKIDKWVNTKCPICKGNAKRETNTMPQWAGSSWYWLRYTDPKNTKEFADIKKQKYWTPVDIYLGGMEHTTLHLLYSRFWNQFLYDQKLVTAKEPFTKRIPHGIILGPDGEKMSKSRGNVVNPDDIVKLYGADTMRVYMAFLGPHEAQIAWNDKGIIGARRFIERVFGIKELITKSEPKEVTIAINKVIKKVGEDIESTAFNTAISALMICTNSIYEHKSITKKSFEKLLIILSPFAPHTCEELWKEIGNKNSIFASKWPNFDSKIVENEQVTIAIQINGKTRGTIEVKKDAEENIVLEKIKKLPQIATKIDGKNVIKTIVVKNKIVNFVVKN